MSTTPNDGPPPVPGQAPKEVDGSVPFDLEEAIDEAAAARRAEESASKVVQISTPASPSTRIIYATEGIGLDLTGEGYDSDGNPPPFSSIFGWRRQKMKRQQREVRKKVQAKSSKSVLQPRLIHAEYTLRRAVVWI